MNEFMEFEELNFLHKSTEFKGDIFTDDFWFIVWWMGGRDGWIVKVYYKLPTRYYWIKAPFCRLPTEKSPLGIFITMTDLSNGF